MQVTYPQLLELVKIFLDRNDDIREWFINHERNAVPFPYHADDSGEWQAWWDRYKQAIRDMTTKEGFIEWVENGSYGPDARYSFRMCLDAVPQVVRQYLAVTPD